MLPVLLRTLTAVFRVSPGLAPDDEPVVSPVCVVSGSEVMTRSGWQPVNSTFEPPFRLRRDQGKTFLQVRGRGGVQRDEEGALE